VKLSATSQEAVLREAVQWFVDLALGPVGEEQRQRWLSWLGDAGSPQRLAWAQIEDLNRRFDGLEQDAAARAILAAPPSVSGRQRRTVLRGLALLMGSGLLGWQCSDSELWQELQADQRTGLGEIRPLLLADGTQLWLDTESAIDVEMGLPQRRLLLRGGQIHVRVAADRRLGAAVEDLELVCRYGRLRVGSSRFTLRLYGQEALLAVYDGAVELLPAPARRRGRRIEAGRQIRFSTDQIALDQPAHPLHQGWTQDRLIAVDMRLDALLAELARYRHGHLGCSEAVAGLRVVGVYPLRNTDLALRALQQALPLQVRQLTPWWLSVEAAGLQQV
jgi:transmembrane sensor